MVSEIVHQLIDGERDNFQSEFQRVLNRVPRRGSTTEPEFSTYFFLGSVLTLPYTELYDEIGVKASSVKITSDHTLKPVFKIQKDGKTKLVFRTIAIGNKIDTAQKLTVDEFKEALGSLDLTEDELNNCEVEGEIVHIENIKEKRRTKGKERAVIDRKVSLKGLEVIGKGELNSKMLKNLGPLPGYNEETAKFKKVKANIIKKGSLDNALKKFSEGALKAEAGELSDSAKGAEAFFENLARVYRSEIVFDQGDKNKSQKLGLSDYEAPIHGFAYGALAMNFRYERGLRIRPEQAAGKGFVDLVVGSRGREFRVELKGHRYTAQDAKLQSEREGYGKAPIIYSFGEEEKAKSVTMVYANLGLDPSSGGLLAEELQLPPKPEGLIELFREHDDESLKGKLKEKLNYLYYSISDSNGGSKNTNYLSRLILGELLADNTLEKHVFTYEENHIKPGSAEHGTRSGQMPKDVITKISEMVSTFLFKKQDGKYVVLNVIEGENFEINKNIPLDGIELSKCKQVNIKVNPEANGGFEAESDTGKSYYQSIEIGEFTTSGSEYYKGKFEKIKHVKLQDITDILQIEKFKAALFPLRKLITSENHFQAILQGLLSVQEGVEVLTEPNYSSKGKPDLLISRRGEYSRTHVAVVELKLALAKEEIEEKRKKGENQLNERANGLETITKEEKVEAVVLVVCPSVKKEEDKFITPFKRERGLNVGHSSRGSGDGEPSPKRRRCLSDRRKRNIGMLCIDSRDREDIEEQDRKEKLVSELFDRDKIREIKENFEFYNQLFEIFDQISKGRTIDEDALKVLMEKVKDIDLGSIDPEIRSIVEEVKEKINSKEISKEIRTILTRSRATEKIGKIAEGAGHALAAFFVAQHMIKGDIEGLGYDALNLWVLPKVGEKVSGELLELGVKYDSQALKGFAPVAGSATGNLLAFVGLGESIKALRDATDPIDIKIAKLNILTNSLFIAADIPAVVAGVMSAAGISAGVVGEFAGPAGAVVSVAVIIASQIESAKLQVEKVEELIKLTDEEKNQLFWRFFLAREMPEYITHDIEAKEIYKKYISEIIDQFKSDYCKIVITLPHIIVKEKKYINVTDTHVAISGIGGPPKDYKVRTKEIDRALDFSSEVNVDLSNIGTGARNYSRIVPGEIKGYHILCGPDDKDIQVGLLKRLEYQDHSFQLSSDYFKNSEDGNNGKMTIERKKWFLSQYPPSCNNAIVYNNQCSNEHESICHIKSRSAEILACGNSNITVIFDGEDISVGLPHKPHVYSGNIFTPETEYKPLENCAVGKPGDNFSTENRYHFLQPLKSCRIDKLGDNFFYIKGNDFSCTISEKGQKNTVVVQGSFTDSKSQNIQAIIGSNTTDSIEVFHAEYVDGKGGNDTIKARNPTTVEGNFGDNIYGKGVVLLPVAFGDIDRMILDGDKNTIYSKDGNLTIHGKEMLMRTKDDFFVTPTKTDTSTQKAAHLNVVNYDATKIVKVLKEASDLQKDFQTVGFHFMNILFKYTCLQNPDCLKVPLLIMSALKGDFITKNPNFEATVQIFSEKVDLVVGDTNHHIFYADKPFHSFYWEGDENVPNLYLFDNKNVTVIINKANGLLDFSRVRGKEKYTLGIGSDAVLVTKGDVNVALPMNYKNVTITSDGRTYYKLSRDGTQEREYCSHKLKIDGRFRVNSTDLLNYNCLTFDSDKVLFLKSDNDLQLVSDKGALSILDYYKLDSDGFHINDLWYVMKIKKYATPYLSIELSNSIINPEEFIRKADNSSTLRYYQPGEEGLEIYHNQPTNNHQIGLMDLKDKSILYCSVEIIDGDLILSSEGKAIAKVKNWNIYQPAREMMFAFGDAVIYNEGCIVSNCDPKDIIKEFEKESAKPVIRGDPTIDKLSLILQDKGVSDEENKRRHRRHHIRHEKRHMGHRNYHSPVQEVTSGGTRSSSWINDLFGWVKSSVGGLLYSRAALPKKTLSTSSPISQVDAQIDVNGIIMLLDVLVRKVTGQKYVSTADQPIISLPEARYHASDIINGFEKVLNETAVKSGISITSLNFDPIKLQSYIVGQLINGKFSEISKTLYLSAKQACPEFKQTKKFLSCLEPRVEEFLNKKEFSFTGPKRKIEEARQIRKQKLCSSANFVTDSSTTVSLSRSEGRLPGDDEPRTCLNDPTEWTTSRGTRQFLPEVVLFHPQKSR